MNIEKLIIDAIVLRLATVTEIVKINSDRIILSTTDFRDYEIPAVQIYDVAQSFIHHRGRVEVNWALALEIVMKSLVSGSVTQNDLWALREKVELALWADPNLNIPGVVHMVYNSNITDLHTIEPYYIARLDFDVKFYKNLTGSC